MRKVKIKRTVGKRVAVENGNAQWIHISPIKNKIMI